MKKIYILLTRTESIVSRIVHLFTADKYTHVAIAFDNELDVIYSSSRKNGRTLFPAGPCREYVDRGVYARSKKTPCALYELQVSDEAYNKALHEIESIMKEQEHYHFNVLGLFVCRLGIAWHRKNKFFCSQFVGEILKRSNALELPKDTALMRPIDYTDMPQLKCRFNGNIGELNLKRKKLLA